MVCSLGPKLFELVLCKSRHLTDVSNTGLRLLYRPNAGCEIDKEYNTGSCNRIVTLYG